MKTPLYTLLFGIVMLTGLKAQELNYMNMRPNNFVYEVEEYNGTLYLGGFFDKVGYLTGNAALFHGEDTLPDLALPYIEGDVHKIIPDGAGGWYLAGFNTPHSLDHLFHFLS